MKPEMILALWKQFEKVPFGKCLFSFILGFVVPYTGTLRMRVESLSAGHARLRLKERWRLRNHLHSVHAMALANFAEAASGIAFLTGLPKGMRAILVGFEIQYVKKARGILMANCRVTPDLFEGFQKSGSSVNKDLEIFVPVEIRDAAGDVVVNARAKWRAGKREGQ